MTQKFRRRKYVVNFSLQFKYVVWSILPALVMSVFCIYFVIASGQLVLDKEKTKIFSEFAAINATLQQEQTQDLSKEVRDRLEITQKRLESFKDIMGIQYYHLAEEWANTKIELFAVLLVILCCFGVISLLYSHRIAGPIVRFERAIDLIQQGKDSGKIKIRKADELQELCMALENLRLIMKHKGYIS